MYKLAYTSYSKYADVWYQIASKAGSASVLPHHEGYIRNFGEGLIAYPKVTDKYY